MDERQLREMFLSRIHLEMLLFKDSMLRRRKADVYAGGYKIVMYVSLYEILMEQAERMPEPLIREMLYRPSGILDAFYLEWLNREDSFYTELRGYVEDELGVILANNTSFDRKDDEDGKRKDQAA